MKVLIVEDNENLRRTIIRFVRRLFHDVDTLGAESADEAIELLKDSVLTREFDLVLCDFNLLGWRTGGDVLEWIRLHLSRLEKRFVFLSSDEQIKKFGVPCFEKPCDLDALKQTLKRLVTPCPDSCIDGHLHPRATDDADGPAVGPCPACNS